MSRPTYDDARIKLCQARHLIGCIVAKAEAEDQHDLAMALEAVVDLLADADEIYETAKLEADGTRKLASLKPAKVGT